jgi:hypothetical protein
LDEHKLWQPAFISDWGTDPHPLLLGGGFPGQFFPSTTLGVEPPVQLPQWLPLAQQIFEPSEHPAALPQRKILLGPDPSHTPQTSTEEPPLQPPQLLPLEQQILVPFVQPALFAQEN